MIIGESVRYALRIQNTAHGRRTPPLLTWRVRGTDGAEARGLPAYWWRRDEADLSEERAYWDSGAILSDTCACTYDGPPLASCTAYVWTVKALCGGVWTAYAPPALFETGLLSRKDWDGVFIGMPNDSRAVALFRHHEPLAARVVRRGCTWQATATRSCG